MAWRMSTGLKNAILSTGGLKQALANGQIRIFSGSQPDSAYVYTLSGAKGGTRAGALAANETFTIRPPEVDYGVTGAVQIDLSVLGGAPASLGKKKPVPIHRAEESFAHEGNSRSLLVSKGSMGTL